MKSSEESWPSEEDMDELKSYGEKIVNAVNLELGTDEEILGKRVSVIEEDGSKIFGEVVGFNNDKFWQRSSAIYIKLDNGEEIFTGRAFVKEEEGD